MKNPVFLLVIAVLFLATGGIFVRLGEVGPIMTGTYRIVLSLPIFLFMYFRRQKASATSTQRSFRELSPRSYFIALYGGVALGFDLICWNISFMYTTVANANLLANMVILINLPVAYFLFKEKIGLPFFVGLGVILVGLGFLFGGKLEASAENFFGDFLAILTALFYAQYLLAVKVMGRECSAPQVMLLTAPGCVAVLMVAAFIVEAPLFFPQTLYGWTMAGGVAIVSHVIGQGLLVHAIPRVNISLSSLIILSQPVVGAIYAFFLFREYLSWLEIIGIFVVLCGLYVAKHKKTVV